MPSLPPEFPPASPPAARPPTTMGWARAHALFALPALVMVLAAGCAQQRTSFTSSSDSTTVRGEGGGAAATPDGEPDLAADSIASDTARTAAAPSSQHALWLRIEGQNAALHAAVAGGRLPEAAQRARSLGDLVAVYTGRVHAPPPTGTTLDSLTEDLSRAAHDLGAAGDHSDAAEAARQYDRIRVALDRIASIAGPA